MPKKANLSKDNSDLRKKKETFYAALNDCPAVNGKPKRLKE